jgi:DNA-binding PadR family transcriptional regulator
MSPRDTEQAALEAAPLEAARAAAGAGGARAAAGAGAPAGAGSADPVAGELRRAGILPLLVLHLLDEGPSYGNRLIERIAEVSGGLLVVNPNTMYPLLRDLEHRGLVAGAWEHPDRRSRRFYTLTPAGSGEREHLRASVAPRLAAVAGAVAALRDELA